MPQHILTDRTVVNRTGNEQRDDDAISDQIAKSRSKLQQVAGSLVRNVRFRHKVELVSEQHLYVTVDMAYDGVKSMEAQIIEEQSLTPEERRKNAIDEMVKDMRDRRLN